VPCGVSGQDKKRSHQDCYAPVTNSIAFECLWEVDKLIDARLLRVMADGKSLLYSHRSAVGDSMLTTVRHLHNKNQYIMLTKSYVGFFAGFYRGLSQPD
jgi:hypothetical protein